VTTTTLKEAVKQQREKLTVMLSAKMHDLGNQIALHIDHRKQLETLLLQALPDFSFCKHLYIMNADGVQITANVTQQGKDDSQYGRNRIDRPYMQGIIGSTDFKLSDAYISRNKKRPSFTAIQVVRDTTGKRVGFLGADFDLRELPGIKETYHESSDWKQIKGDPAIRSAVFQQRRVESMMDQHLDDVLPIINELITKHGVFHGKLHFSSSRATIWVIDDPYNYRILSFDEIIDPDTCLAYPRHDYFERAIVPEDKVMPVFELFRTLRFADENVYLRAGSLNIVNGMVGLNFSCDGSHYMRYDEFLEKSTDFWFGSV
jgi:hypothetical protein